MYTARGTSYRVTSWLQAIWGQGVRPRGTHPVVEAVTAHDRAGYLRDLRRLFAQAAQKLNGDAELIARNCAAATYGSN